MALSQRQAAFIQKYSSYAINEQIKYGIPASITMAQMIEESGWGEKSLGNNCFGIKAGSGWEGSRILNPKDGQYYRNYSSIEEGIENHSKVLLQDNYAYCRQFNCLDHHNWAIGLSRCNYATNPGYADNLESHIRQGGLEYLDRIGLDLANKYHIRIGSGQGLDKILNNQRAYLLSPDAGSRFHLPLDITGGMRVTGMVGDFRKSHPNTPHQGVDISTNHTIVPLYATEDNGRVVRIGRAGDGNGGGNRVTVEYRRPDGTRFQCVYMHLDKIAVHDGQTVNAGDVIGMSGNTGISSGPHLHFEYRTFQNGEFKTDDPLRYLAELEVRSGSQAALVKDGNDVLEGYRSQMSFNDGTMQQTADVNQLESEDEKNMISSLFGTDGMSQGGNILSQMFESIIMMAMQLDASRYLGDKSDEQLKEERERQEDADQTKVKGNEDAVHLSREELSGKEISDLASANMEKIIEEQSQQEQLQALQLKG